jgi:hypothetical protein
MSTFTLCGWHELTLVDEPLYIFLCVRSSAGVRPIPQDKTKGPANELFATVPLTSNASATSEESTHRVVLGSTGS